MPDNAHIREETSLKGEGFYLFCFAHSHKLPLFEMHGLDDRYAVTRKVFKEIVAVYSRVSLEDFCGPSAESRLQDVAWIGPRACRHEEVIEQVMRHSPVFPTRFGTIFSSTQRLEQLLKIHYGTIFQFLEQTHNKEEVALKGFVDRDQAKKTLVTAALDGEAERLAELSPGMRYFQKKQTLSGAEKDLNRHLKEVLEAIWNDFKNYATDFSERKLMSREATGLEVDMVLNWAFLLARDSKEDFRERVNQARDDHAKLGLTFELSGPWPPYSFCPPLELE